MTQLTASLPPRLRGASPARSARLAGHGPTLLAAVRRLPLILALAALLLPAGTAAARSHRPPPLRVPHGWNGVVVNRDQLGTDTQAGREWNRMVGAGVETVRAAFYWSSAQAHRTTGDVPQNSLADGTYEPDGHGIPTAYGDMDKIVEANARHGLTLLPVVLGAPNWAAVDPQNSISRPKDAHDYANFLTDLVTRYGPSGTFWARHHDVPKRPIRQWQVWNEPNIGFFWHAPHMAGYATLLHAAHDAIKRADRGASVILAGLSSSKQSRPWTSLAELYRAGARRLFDAVAVHPYSLQPKNVMRIISNVRTVMRRYRDGRKPLWVTELSWPSASGRSNYNAYNFNVTESRQAQKIREIYPMLARARRSLGIARVYWYTWITSYRGRGDPFDYAGLRAAAPSDSTDSHAKPAFGAWQHVVLSLEGCRRPKRDVNHCG